MTKDETMMSLWDYRGHADKDKTGQRLYEAAAKKAGESRSTRTPQEQYKGRVLLYPKWFLDEYFNPTINLTAKDTEDDELPF